MISGGRRLDVSRSGRFAGRSLRTQFPAMRPAICAAFFLFACGQATRPPDPASVVPTGTGAEADGGSVSNGGSSADAGSTDSGSSDGGGSTASDAGTADAGTPDGGTADGGTSDGGTSACASSAPVLPCEAKLPDTSHAVCKTLDVEPPRQLLDGGIPGPCEETDWDESGFFFLEHFVQSFDESGNLRSRTELDEHGGVVVTSTWDYDPCGRLVHGETVRRGSATEAFEYDYGPDGFLARKVQQSGSSCSAQAFSYVVDGALVTRYDSATCTKVADYTFGTDGRVASKNGPNSATASYGYFPNGAVQTINSHFPFEEDDSTTYDETGARILDQRQGLGIPAFSSNASWSYSPDHRLLEFKSFFHDHGPCGTWTSDGVLTWDADLLVEQDVTSGSGCPFETVKTIFKYDHPDTGVQIERELAPDGSAKRLKRTVSDARGNPVAIDVMAPPDTVWHPVSRRNYDCFAKPASVLPVYSGVYK